MQTDQLETKPQGLTCPCGGDYRVLDSRPCEGWIRRRRECLLCRKRVSTYQLVLPDDVTPTDLMRASTVLNRLEEIKAEVRRDMEAELVRITHNALNRMVTPQ